LFLLAAGVHVPVWSRMLCPAGTDTVSIPGMAQPTDTWVGKVSAPGRIAEPDELAAVAVGG
jgi:hypothetical protein